MSTSDQPVTARSLDLGLRHLGYVVRIEHSTRCAVCAEVIAAGSIGIECAATQAIAHRACGEVMRPGGAA